MECASDICFYYSFMDILPTFTSSAMSPLSGTSSSEEELDSGHPQEDSPVVVVADPLSIATSTPAEASSSRPKYGKLKRMLQLVLEAVRVQPSDNPAKGISIQKIKAYLRNAHRLRKMDIQTHLRSALETAIKRKMLLKTAGRASVLIGSVKLNPAYRATGSTEDSGSSDEEEPAVELKQVAGKKRKAVKEPEPETVNNKRRK